MRSSDQAAGEIPMTEYESRSLHYLSPAADPKLNTVILEWQLAFGPMSKRAKAPAMGAGASLVGHDRGLLMPAPQLPSRE